MTKLGQASAIIWVLLAVWQCTDVNAQQAREEGAYVDEVVNVIREALKEAQTNNIPGFPPLKDVTISLQALTAVIAGGGINFWIFTVGTKYENETASTVKLIMTPPPTTVGLLSPSADKLKLALARAINLAKVGVLNANKQEPPLRMSNVEIEIKFAVKVEGSGGIKIAQILPIGIEGTGKLNKNQIHTIALRFMKPKPDGR
jgi:Trypsin-co-occurring domain 2